MVLKIKMLSKKLIVMLSVLLLALVTFICFAGQVNVSAASVSDTDKGIYNTNWSIGKVKYYINRQKKFLGMGVDKTYLYISLVDENGKHLDNVTKIEMTYFIGGENYHVIKDVEKYTNNYHISFSNMFSKEGQLSKAVNGDNVLFHKKFTDSKYEDVTIDYVWFFNFYVSDSVILYAYYKDPVTGKDAAISFFPDGEHPMYDDNGNLIGIFDVDGNLLDNCTLNENGIPSTITKSDDGKITTTPIITPDDQNGGEHVDKIVPLPDIPGIGDINTGIDKLNTVLKTLVIVAEVVAGLIVLLYLVKFFKWLYRLIKGAIK